MFKLLFLTVSSFLQISGREIVVPKTNTTISELNLLFEYILVIHKAMREDRSKAMAIFGKHDYLLRFWNDLTPEERQQLVDQFTMYNMHEIDKAFKESGIPMKLEGLAPISGDRYSVANDIDENIMKEYWHIGLEAIAKGEVAAVVLAGGQATRLGSAVPKGTLSLGFTECDITDSLFAIQAARISRLQDLARMAFPNSKPKIWWIVLTSSATAEATLKHLRDVLPVAMIDPGQLIVLAQRSIPCFDINGGLFLSSKSSFEVSPNGNGGLYECLEAHCTSSLNNQIKYFHVFSVDNVLCRVADPHFIGYCIKNDVDCAAKVVEKIDPFERVGVICQTLDGVQVVEYSDLSTELSLARDDSGRLKFRAGNIASHFFTCDFVHAAATYKLPLHRAFKKIPFIDRMTGMLVKPETENGYKLEFFIFDAFKCAKNFHVWEVKRSEEFSPLKNAESVGKDCMSTCRRDYYAECKRWLIKANVPIHVDRPIFIHPFYSYSGEGLEEYHERGLAGDLLP
ncbi:UTP--glucose-1-phosphate uridylyltransferase family protein [Acanthocheilonema viteae]